MPLDPNAIHIHTDGSCYGNPGGSGGAAAIVTFPDHLNLPREQIFDFGCAETSNNRMELRACIGALEWIRRHRLWPGVDRVQLVSDSMYVIENLPRAVGWKKNDWRNLHGEPKENADLWKSLLSAYAKVGMRVYFIWRAGKTSPTLKDVDKVAKAAAKRGSIGLDTGYKSGKVSRSKVKGSATIFPAQGQDAVIRPYRKTAPSKGENRIRFDLFVEDSGEYVASHYAYATDSLTAELHRQHLYRVKFNNNSHNPRIEEIIEEVSPPATS
jgi:ribonuclease HI